MLLAAFLGCAALWICVAYPYVPLDNFELARGVVLPCFAVVSFVLFEVRKRPPTLRHWLAAAAPWIVAGVFVLNGALDPSPGIRHSTVVQHGYVYRADLRHAMVARSWRPGRTTESIPYEALRRFYVDDERISITVRSGVFGIPWVSRVEP